MKISISKENLMEPTCEWVKITLENFIEFFTGKNIEFICQPKFNALNCFLHPELHEESIGFIVKHRFFQDLIFSSGYKEFSLRDYFFPTFPKVRKIFSAVINFAKFREEFILFLKNFDKTFNKLFQLNLENFIQITFLELKIDFLLGKSLIKEFVYKKLKKRRKFFASLVRFKYHIFLSILRIIHLSNLKLRDFIDRFLIKKKQEYSCNSFHFEKLSFFIFKIWLPISVGQIYLGEVFYKFTLIVNSIKKKISYRIRKFRLTKLNFSLVFKTLKKIKITKALDFSDQYILKNKIHVFINQKNYIKEIFREANRMKNKNKMYGFFLGVPKNLRKINRLIFTISKKFKSFKKRIHFNKNGNPFKPDSISSLIFQFLMTQRKIRFLEIEEF